MVYTLRGEELMFNIGMPELLIILAIALIVFGPNKLPELARAFGRAMREFRKATEEVKQSFEAETRDLDELKSTLHEEKEKFLDNLSREDSETRETSATPSQVVTEPSMPSESSGPLETPSLEAGSLPGEGKKAESAKKAEPQG